MKLASTRVATREHARDTARRTPAWAAGRRGAAGVADTRASVVAQARLDDALDRSPSVQSVRGPQQALDASPRVVAQARRAQALSARLSPLRGPADGGAQPETAQLFQAEPDAAPVQAVAGGEHVSAPAEDAPAPNDTGLPDALKAGLEATSGVDLSSLRVHYNASEPAQLSALAYAQGDHIYLGPGQEQHLPHEGWHAVQQRQGRVSPTGRLAGQAVNDDTSLEREADVMGSRAAQMRFASPRPAAIARRSTAGIAQRATAGVAQLAFDAAAFGVALGADDFAEAARLAGQADSAADLNARLVEAALGAPGAAQAPFMQRLHQVYEASRTPWVKLELWRVWASQSHLDRVLGAGAALDPARVADVGGLYDDILNAGRLLGLRQQRENAGFRSLFGADARRQRHVQEIEALAVRTTLAQDLSFRHQIGIRNRALPADISDEQRLVRERNFSAGELRTLGSVLDRLPAAHVAQNPHLGFFQRADRHEDAHNAGAEYQEDTHAVQVYDLGFGGRYRAAGSQSVLGEHPADAPLSGGEEALTHEIGHSVEHLRPQGYAALRAGAGWQAINAVGALRGMLTVGGLGGAAADAFIGRLQATRGQNFAARHTETQGNYTYMVDPYSDGFLRRRVNRMVGDAATTETIPEGGRSLMPYAQSSPTEFFAEMYSQMVHVPERVYESYVEAPATRMQAAAALVPAEDAAGYAAARAAFTERQGQADALRAQWVAMREQVFGVTRQSELDAVQGLRDWAGAQGIAQVNRTAALLAFRQAVVKAATPRQIEVLVAQARAAMQQRHVANPVADPLPVALVPAPPPALPLVPAHDVPPAPPQDVGVMPPQNSGVVAPTTDVGQLRAAPVIQRRIAARAEIPTGTLEVDFTPRNPRYGLGFAQERGHVTFYPGAAAPDTRAIYMEQLVKLTAEQQGLPDESDFLLESQKTRGTGGGEAGFYVDQVPRDLDERIGQAGFTNALQEGRAHFYAESGAPATVGLTSVLRAVDNSDDLAAASAETGLTQHQLTLIEGWMNWARERGFLGDALSTGSIATALIRTVQDKRGVPPRLLQWGSGLDVDLLSEVQTYVEAHEDTQSVEQMADAALFQERELPQNSIGWKEGEQSHPASLWDTPGSKHPAKFDFKTAPFDQTHGEYLGGYAEWGFEVEAVAHQGRVAVKPSSEYARIEDEMWDDYTDTATEAKGKFYAEWGRRNASRGFTQIGPNHYEKDGAFYNYVADAMAMVPLPPGVTRADLRDVLYPPPPLPPPRALLPAPPQAALEPVAPDYAVTAYKLGQLGVYFMAGPGGELVVKPMHSVFNEIFAVNVAAMLGIRQPETRAVAAGSARGVAFTKAILASEHRGEYLERFERTAPKFFMVMSKVGGRTLEAAQESGVGELAPLGDLRPFVADLGQIVAYDILLYYRDRTSLIGGGNLANLMLEKAPGLRGVALDQRVNVKERGIFDSRPLDDIRGAVEEIVRGDEARLGRLWDDLPAAIQGGLGDKAQGLVLLRRSLLDGLRHIVKTLSPEALGKLYEELSVLKLPPAPLSSFSSFLLSPAASADDVDLNALVGSLGAIKAGLASSLGQL